jgi:hypothetical protein
MDRSLIMILTIVAAVLFTGWLTIANPGTPTGHVVDPCASCEGLPVCAGKDGVASNYGSACAAMCDDARVIYQDLCEKIPKATT